jgi:hypothetical protein
VTVVSHITLDGVVQAPARPDEDPRDGFAYSGWTVPYGDPAIIDAWGEHIAKATQGGPGRTPVLGEGRRLFRPDGRTPN